MTGPPKRVAPRAPLYFGGVAANQPTAEMIAALEGSLALTFTQMTDQIADAQVPPSAVTQHQAALAIAWSQITAPPTTIAGYGITDAYTKTASDARFAPIAGPFPWADVTGQPTTVAGYGITDAYTKTESDALYAPVAGPFPWADVTGAPTFITGGPYAWADITGQPTAVAGYGITDVYTKTDSDSLFAPIAGPFPWADVTGAPAFITGGPFAWADITGQPTTLLGYGITDAYDKTTSDARYSPIAGPFPWANVTGAPLFLTSTGPFPWANITGAPTSLAGYGITDAYTKTAGDARYAAIAGPFPWADVTGAPAFLTATGPFAWANVTGRPTTIAGYGITDLNTLGDARWSPLAGSSSLVTVGVLASPHMTSPVVNSGGATITAGNLVVTAGNLQVTAGLFSLGAAINVAVGAYINPTTMTGTTQYGLLITPVYGSGATTTGAGFVIGASTVVAAFTMTQFICLNLTDLVLGAGAHVTTSYGLKVNDIAAGTTNYALYTGLGVVRLGDAVTMASTLTFSTAASRIIPGATSLSLRNTANSADNLLITDAGVATIRAGLTVTAGTLFVLGTGFGRVAGGSSGLAFRDGTDSFALCLLTSATRIADYFSLGVGSSAALGTLSINAVNWYGLHVFDPVMFTGKTITNDYGIYIENIAVGGTLNYALYTNTGLVRFGDAVTMASSLKVTTGFGCNGAAPQTAFASGGALAAYVTGAFGFDTAAHASALYAMVVALRAMAVANGLMS